MLLLLAGSLAAQDTTLTPVYQPETMGQFLMSTFGPRQTLRAIGLAGLNQLQGHPKNFPRTWRGYEDRLGTAYAQVAISHTLRSSTAHLAQQRTLPFKPCVCTDSSRLRYALLSPFRVITPTGVRLSAYNPVTEIVSGILVTPLRGPGIRVGEGVANGIVGIVSESAFDVVREFWPWKWRPRFM